MSERDSGSIAVGLHIDHNAGMAAVRENEVVLYCEFERLTRVKNQIGWFPDLVGDLLERLPLEEVAVICLSEPSLMVDLLVERFGAVKESANQVRVAGHPITLYSQELANQDDMHPLLHVLATIPLADLQPEVYAILIFDAEQPRFSWVDLRSGMEQTPPITFKKVSNDRWFNGELFSAFYGKLFYGSHDLSNCGKLMGLASWGRTRTLYMDWLREAAQRHFNPALPTWQGYSEASKDAIIQGMRHRMGVDPQQHEHPKVLDLAASAQEMFTHEMMLQVVVGIEAVHAELRELNLPPPAGLLYAGGCALSVVSNAVLREMLALPLIIPPYAHDASQFLGSAIWASLRSRLGTWRPGSWPGIPQHTLGRVEASMLTQFGVPVCPAHPEDLASRIIAGALIALIEGGSEAGPRALGKRSLLANALDPNMRDRINRDVKRREWYRPFAPALPAEAFPRYFGEPATGPAQYMLDAFRIVPHYRSLLASVSSPDGTSRPQAVHAHLSPWYHSLLSAMGHRTGHPIVLNTSLNAPGLTIALDLYQSFEDCLALGIDAAVVDGFLIEREGIARVVAEGKVKCGHPVGVRR